LGDSEGPVSLRGVVVDKKSLESENSDTRPNKNTRLPLPSINYFHSVPVQPIEAIKGSRPSCPDLRDHHNRSL